MMYTIPEMNRDQLREARESAKRKAARDRRLAELRPTYTTAERLADMLKSNIGRRLPNGN